MTCGTFCAGVQQDCLHRVLRAAVNYHCLAVAPGAWGRAARFQNNALSSLLLKDHPAHMSSFVRALPALPRLHHGYHPAASSAKATALFVLCSCMFKGFVIGMHTCWMACRLVHMSISPAAGVLFVSLQELPQVHLVVDNSWKAWGVMPWVVQTGKNGYKHAHNGTSLWEYLQASPFRTLPSQQIAGACSLAELLARLGRGRQSGTCLC